MGEHTTEARGVGGSIPSLPISQRNVYITLSIILNMKKEESVKKHSDNSFGVVSVVLGIVAIVISIVFFFGFGPIAGIIFGIIGLVFAMKQKKYSGKNGWYKAGFWLNIAGIIIGFLVLIWFVKNLLEAFIEIQKQGLLNQYDIPNSS